MLNTLRIAAPKFVASHARQIQDLEAICLALNLFRECSKVLRSKLSGAVKRSELKCPARPDAISPLPALNGMAFASLSHEVSLSYESSMKTGRIAKRRSLNQMPNAVDTCETGRDVRRRLWQFS